MDAKPLPSSPSCLCFSPTYPVLFLFPGSSDGKESACNVEDLYSFPGSGRSPGEGNGNPLKYSCLENPMDCSLPGFSVEFSRQEYWMGCHSLLHGIFPTQGSNPGLLHCRQILYHLSYEGSLELLKKLSNKLKAKSQLLP